MTLYANFHDVVGVEIETQRAEAREFFSAEYAMHLVDGLPKDMPRVYLRFQPSLGLFAPKGYIFHAHKGLARWAYRLQFDADKILIDVYGNRMAIPMLHHMLVHPSLRYLASQRDVLMLHAGAVADDKYSLILTGHGGAGKTTTTSLLLSSKDANWGLHADDYVFLRTGPYSLAYLTRAHLYRTLLRWVPDVATRLTPWEHMRLEFFGRLRSWSGERIKWPVRLDLRRLWPERSTHMRAHPVALVILERSDISVPQVVPLDETTFPFDALLQMNFYEARHFIHLVRKSAVVGDVDAWLDAWRAREQTLLRQISRQIPSFTLRLPVQASSPEDARQHVLGEVSKLVTQQKGIA